MGLHRVFQGFLTYNELWIALWSEVVNPCKLLPVAELRLAGKLVAYIPPTCSWMSRRRCFHAELALPNHPWEFFSKAIFNGRTTLQCRGHAKQCRRVLNMVKQSRGCDRIPSNHPKIRTGIQEDYFVDLCWPCQRRAAKIRPWSWQQHADRASQAYLFLSVELLFDGREMCPDF